VPLPSEKEKSVSLCFRVRKGNRVLVLDSFALASSEQNGHIRGSHSMTLA